MKGKKIVLGLTGCIAAYKSCQLVRDFIKLGAEVKVVMTPSASEFVSPLTLSILSKNEVIQNIFPVNQKINLNHNTWHIELGLWADVMVIAPASVNTVAKLAYGISDNPVTVLACALRCPLIVAPAADVDMYEHPATQENITKLESRGVYIIEAEVGELASGLEGRGRMPDLRKITDSVTTVLAGFKKDFAGKKILISAGPTYEDIDPVRYIGNRSSGKMGFQIAKASYLRGAEVTLISGPSSQEVYQGIDLIRIRSAQEMRKAIDGNLEQNEILIMSAAVADFRPENQYETKIKKEDGLASILLVKTDDILSSISKTGKIIVGFALETDNAFENAKKKLIGKNLDMIILNSPTNEGSGFEYDTNSVTIINKNLEAVKIDLADKFIVGHKILDEIIKICNARDKK